MFNGRGQDSDNFGEEAGSEWKETQDMRLQGIDNILLLDLGVNYMGEFCVSKFIELYADDLCTICLHQYKLKNTREISQNIPLAFTLCYQVVA